MLNKSNKMNKIILLLIAVFFITFSSCSDSDRDRDTSTESSKDAWIAINHFNTLMREVHRVASVDTVLNNVDTANARVPDVCMDSINRYPDQGPYPINLVINYNKNKTCSGHRNRDGKIYATFTGPYSSVGTKISITTQNYMVDGYAISGAIEMEVTYEAIDTLTFAVEIKNATLTNSEGIGNQTSLFESNLTFMQYTGKKTIGTDDDEFLITGAGNGMAHNGVIYTYTTEFDNILAGTCNYETFGSFRLKSANQLDRIGNYGEGGGCDNIMLVSIPPVNGDVQVEIP